MPTNHSNMRATHDHAGIAAHRFKMRAQIASYPDCERAMELLDGDGDGFAQIGPNMTLIREGHPKDAEPATYAIELYSTKIVRYYPDGTFSADNGGFRTPTTRARIEAVIPAHYMVSHDKKLLRVSGFYPATHAVRIPVDKKEA